MLDPGIASYFNLLNAAYNGPLWDQQKERLTALNAFVVAHGGRLSLVTFPFLHALGPEYEYRGVHDNLNRLWRELGVPHLDLLEIYASHAPSELVVGKRDAHPNEKAHAMAADVIDAFIKNQLSIQPSKPPANPAPQ